MKREEMKEKRKRTETWRNTHREVKMPLPIALAALAVLVGVSLCALRTAPVPENRDAVVQEVIAVAEEREIPPVIPNAEEPSPSGSGQSTVPEKENTSEKESVPETEIGETHVSPKEVKTVPSSQVQETQPTVSESPHTHSWVPVFVTVRHDAVTHIVHHDAVTQNMHHDTETHEEPVYEYRAICDTCGSDITGYIPDHIGPVCPGSYSVQQIQTGINIAVDREEYDEEVTVQNAWDETVIDQGAYDEEITTGYRCEGCGEWKEL